MEKEKNPDEYPDEDMITRCVKLLNRYLDSDKPVNASDAENVVSELIDIISS